MHEIEALIAHRLISQTRLGGRAGLAYEKECVCLTEVKWCEDASVANHLVCVHPYLTCLYVFVLSHSRVGEVCVELQLMHLISVIYLNCVCVFVPVCFLKGFTSMHLSLLSLTNFFSLIYIYIIFHCCLSHHC